MQKYKVEQKRYYISICLIASIYVTFDLWGKLFFVVTIVVMSHLKMRVEPTVHMLSVSSIPQTMAKFIRK
jgi:hypothetical protein